MSARSAVSLDVVLQEYFIHSYMFSLFIELTIAMYHISLMYQHLTRYHHHHELYPSKGQIVPHDTSSSSPLALSSSNAPAEVDGSPSNDAASNKGKITRLFHLDKRGHTDTTGDVTATSSNSESPVLQPNKSSSTSSQPLANAHTTTIKDSPDNKNLADTSSGNKIANATVIVDIVKDIREVLDKVPYVKVVAGLASTGMKIVDVCCHFGVSLLY